MRPRSAHGQSRAARARHLASRYPASREALLFFARLAEFEGGLAELHDLIRHHAPEPLRSAEAPDASDLPLLFEAYLGGRDISSPESLYARVLLRLAPPKNADPDRGTQSGSCGACGQPPQCGALRPQGDGAALWLVCSLCLDEWSFARATCPACGETDPNRIGFYSAEDQFPYIQVQACDTCRRYLHLIDLAKDPQAIADVDEIAALPLDVWAREQGFAKIHPNWIGI